MSDEQTYEQQITRDRPTLAIADDDAFMCSMLATQLGFAFECVGTAADTDAAIELASVQQPDAMILDVIMPGGGALKATRAIRASSPNTAIVILSSDELHSDVIDLLNAGASAYLRKGIDAQDLAQGLTASIAAHGHARERVSAVADTESHASGGARS
ncbi:MAG TPA: response regulator transcription factor [Solirubrobacteraceae bacterium]|jgi:DNA-binding NarL/FixJ family response regulator